MFCKGTHSYLRGILQIHTHTHTKSLFLLSLAQLHQMLVKVFPDPCQGFFLRQEPANSQRVWLRFQPTVECISKKHHNISKRIQKAASSQCLPPSWWTLPLNAAQMVFCGSSVSSLSAQLLREDAHNYNQQSEPAPQRSVVITATPAPARPRCSLCHNTAHVIFIF